ncbi:MAG: potassium transporter Trk [Candidatus Sericytochromatia bacterium]|nr:MAG: potassium transporter Trk [Candidatus Sericytochromatia bacterium]
MKKKKFAIIGIGKFGYNIAVTLAKYKKDNEVIAIDKSKDLINKITSFVDNAYIIDAMDEEALREIGIENVDTAIVSIGENIEASLIIVMNLLEIGVKNLIVKAVNQLHKKILKKIGVTRIVEPEEEMAIKVAHSLVTTNILEEICLTDDYSVFEISAPQKIWGRTLSSLDLRKKYGISIIGIKHGNNFKPNPSPDTVINKDDLLLIMSDAKSIAKFTN